MRIPWTKLWNEFGKQTSKMGAPTNLSDQGAGEMSATAKMHAEPAMRLNQLTRYYIMTGLVFLMASLAVRFTEIIFTLRGMTGDFEPLLLVAIISLFAGLAIKFLPSSLGGNPHLYSLTMALYSYWFIVIGGSLWFLSVFLYNWLFANEGSSILMMIIQSMGPASLLIGVFLLTINLRKTMKNRI